MTIERLHGWHNAIFAHTSGYEGIKKITIGAFRDYDDMRGVENVFGRKGKIVKYCS